MKKSLLAFAALILSPTVMAEAPTQSWAKLIDSPQTQDLTSKVILCNDGNPVTLSQFGSQSATDNISYDGQVIATGSATNSSSNNANLLILKHSAKDGSLLWAVSSKSGDIIVSSDGNIAATADGGVLALLKMRSSKLTPYISPVLVDNSGAEVEFPDWNTSEWIYNQVLVKINAQGNIEWTRTIVMDQLPVPAASSGNSVNATTNGVTPFALALDAEGNIYIGGNYRAPMIVGGENNGVFVLTPRNLDTYNGDTQQSAGGLYLIKLNPEGYYVNHLRASGTLTRDQIRCFAIDGSDLYFTGNMLGAVGSSLTLGGKTVTVESTYDSFMFGCVSTDLKTVKYLTGVKSFGNKSSKQAVKLRALNVSGGYLYVCGGGTGSYGPAGSSAAAVSSTGTLEEGWVIRFNASDGSWDAAANNDINIGAYLGMFEYNSRLYILGYRLNANDGVFLDEYPLSGSLVRAGRYTLVKGGGAPTGYSVAFDPTSTRVFAAARGNNTFTLADGSTTDKPANWGGLLSCCHFDAEASINEVLNSKGALSIRGEQGAIVVEAQDPVRITVSDTKGLTVYDSEVTEGVTRVALPAGVYIANSAKVLVR